MTAIADELEALEVKSAELAKAWEAVKGQTAEVVRLQQAIEEARHRLEVAQRSGDLGMAAELTYGQLPALEQDLKAAKDAVAAAETMNEAVTSQHIAEVISKWTGIPIDKMLEGERDKLLAMEDHIGKRVIGQQEAVAAVANATRRSRAGLADQANRWAFFMLGQPVLAKLN